MLTSFETALTVKKQLSENTYLLTFKLIEANTVNFLAGQYMVLKVPKNGSFAPRLYSIASPPSMKDGFELLVEIIPGGIGSMYLDSLSLNQKVSFMGPAGQFVIKNPTKKKTFLITGTGIAPVRSMLLTGLENYDLYWGMKTYKDLYLFDDLKRFNINICLSRETSLEIIPFEIRKYFKLGRVDACFANSLKNKAEDEIYNMDYYLCGSREAVESLRIFLLSKQVPKENIYFEKF